MHFGIICPPVPGHIYPFGALGRELIVRGHRVTLIQMEDVRVRAESEGLEFLPVGQADHPRGSLAESLRELGRLHGLAALKFTVRAVGRTTVMFCRDGPNAIRAAGIDALLVDQMEPAGGAIAEYLGVPFVTVCNALALNRESAVPPPFTPWTYTDRPWARVRNEIGYFVSDRTMRPVSHVVAEFRKERRLPAHRIPDDSFSPLAQVSQQAPAFDFPRRSLPPAFHYVGPLRDTRSGQIPFPWERLNGKPIVYASLGTLQQSKANIFRSFAEACAGLGVQLVIAHNGGLDDTAVASLPGDPLAVHFAPQTEILSRASLALTHAGLNTVLDALTYGVPMVAVPVTYEQPAIAARVEWSGAGRSLPLSRLSTKRLRALVREVLEKPGYASSARRVADSIRAAGGVRRAADIVEKALRAERSVRAGLSQTPACQSRS
jgi:MGT family glycosyltransferase